MTREPAQPRFFTPRNYERPTLGGEVAEIMRQLGTPPMPWQAQHLDVVYEVDVEATEEARSVASSNGVHKSDLADIVRLWYREDRLTVPRQSGKTTDTLGRHVDRHKNGRRRGWGVRPVTIYMAQSATDSRDKMVEEWWPILEESPLLEDVEQLIRSNGREQIRFKSPGGRIITAPPTRKGGHGKTGVGLAHFDEAFAYSDAAAEQGIRPTMITQVSPQLGILSTAGTAESTYLWEKVDDGRARCQVRDWGRVAYFEWSAYRGDPNTVPIGELDPDDPETWWACMPALGITQPLDAVQAEHDSMPLEEFKRAYLNLWTTSVARIIPADAWANIMRPESKIAGRMFLAVDASPGKGSGRVAATAIGGRNEYRQSHVEVIDSAPGLGWVAQRVGELTRKYPRIEEVWLDTAGPIGSVLPDIEREAACNIHVVNAHEMAAACGRFHEDVMEGVNVCHIGQDVLDAAVDGAAKRTLLDSWAWARRTSQSDISPLVAVTLAHWATVTHPDELQRIR